MGANAWELLASLEAPGDCGFLSFALEAIGQMFVDCMCMKKLKRVWYNLVTHCMLGAKFRLALYVCANKE